MDHLLTLDFSVLSWRKKLVFCFAVLRGLQIQVEDPSPNIFDEEYDAYTGELH